VENLFAKDFYFAYLFFLTMFLIMIFKRLGWKENKYVMAIIYGLVYALLFTITFSIVQFFVNGSLRVDKIYVLLIFFVGVVIYLIKWHFIKSTLQIKKTKMGK